MKRLLFITSLLISGNAYASPFNGAYIGVQAGYEDYHATDTFTGAGALAGTTVTGSGDLSGAVGGLYAGYGETFGKFYLGTELTGDLSSSDKSESASGITSDMKHNYSYGVSVRPGYVVGDNLLLYSRLGWIASNFKQSYSGLLTGGTNVTANGIDTGLGAEYVISSNITARLDWTYASYQKVNVTEIVNGANLGTDAISPSSNTFRVGIAYNF